jgi:putative hydroxymethylpyrimidine transport system substrate-binding protein
MKKFLFIMLLFLSSHCLGADKLIVLLDWFPNPDHAPLIIAKELGYFQKLGLDVELIGPADPTDPPKLVAAGKADIAITYQPQFLQQVENGLPLVMLGTLIDKPLNCLTVLKEGPIRKLIDLKGKRIGTSTGGMNSLMLKVMLAKKNINLDQVETINVHYDLTQALLSGKVDAVTGMMRNFEVLQLEMAGHAAHVFYPEQYGFPNYSELIFVIQKNHKKDELYSHFLQAIKLAINYIQANSETSWIIFAKKFPENDNELNHRAWQQTLPYFAKDPAAIN